jgi:phosphoribosylanthranilate isomerase
LTHPLGRTRIKFCGLTRAEDVDLAVELGVDALGFVLYPQSPRFVSDQQMAALVSRVPAFVTTVGLFVDAPSSTILQTLDSVALSALQFHGEESAEECERYRLPWLKAARVRPGLDLLEFSRHYPGAQALLLDAFVEGYGGAGERFDWSLVPNEVAPRAVLSGGLSALNVGEAIARVRPYAVDVSSGIELSKGIKDPQRMRQFVAAVRRADDLLSSPP